MSGNFNLIARRDPFAEFDTLIRRAFPARPLPGRDGLATVSQQGFVPAADIARNGDDALITLELPGLDFEKDITVERDGNELVVHGERRDERDETTDDGFLREIRYGSFRRVFTLPEHVSDDQVSASYDAGVLAVTISDAYVGTQPRKIDVTAGNGSATRTVENTADNTVDAN